MESNRLSAALVSTQWFSLSSIEFPGHWLRGRYALVESAVKIPTRFRGNVAVSKFFLKNKSTLHHFPERISTDTSTSTHPQRIHLHVHYLDFQMIAKSEKDFIYHQSSLICFPRVVLRRSLKYAVDLNQEKQFFDRANFSTSTSPWNKNNKRFYLFSIFFKQLFLQLFVQTNNKMYFADRIWLRAEKEGEIFSFSYASHDIPQIFYRVTIS